MAVGGAVDLRRLETMHQNAWKKTSKDLMDLLIDSRDVEAVTMSYRRVREQGHVHRSDDECVFKWRSPIIASIRNLKSKCEAELERLRQYGLSQQWRSSRLNSRTRLPPLPEAESVSPDLIMRTPPAAQGLEKSTSLSPLVSRRQKGSDVQSRGMPQTQSVEVPRSFPVPQYLLRASVPPNLSDVSDNPLISR